MIVRRIRRAIRLQLERRGFAVTPMPRFLASRPECRGAVDVLNLFLKDYFERQVATFIQIGANDGRSNDHLHEFINSDGWRGVLVEPMPDAYRSLEATYKGNDRVRLVNKAVGTANETLRLYYIDRPDIPGLGQLTSFLRANVLAHRRYLRHLDYGPADVKACDVPCVTLPTLVAEHGVTELDVLQIDAEGMDCHILAGLDLNRLRPRVITFEFVHAPVELLDATMARLAAFGYSFMVPNPLDVTAFLPRRHALPQD